MGIADSLHKEPILCCFVLLWSAALAGFAYLANYDLKPGLSARCQSEWPPQSKLEAGGNGPTLLIFLHPQCPCSSATIDELEKVLHGAGAAKLRVSEHQLKVYAVLWTPRHRPPAWKDSVLGDSLNAIPEAAKFVDEDGEETRLFGASTSGTVLLFSSSGKLLFNGGITESRGHRGDNNGADALSLEIAHSLQSPTNKKSLPGKEVSFPVFGCCMESGEKK